MSGALQLAAGLTIAGYFFIVLGIPCIFLGVYLRRNPPEEKKQKGQGKKQQSKKDKKKSKRQSKKKDEPKQSAGSPAGGLSLIVGGLLFVGLGIGFLIMQSLK